MDCCEKTFLPKKDCKWLNFDTPSNIQIIDGSECIGDSLTKINTNFAYLSTLCLNFLYDTCSTFWDVMMCYNSAEQRQCNQFYPAGCETGDEAELPLVKGGLWGQYYEMDSTYSSTIRQGNFEHLPLTDSFFIPKLDYSTTPQNHGLIVIGYFKPPFTGEYTFYLRSKYGSAMWINDLALGWTGRTTTNAFINNNLLLANFTSPTESSSTIFLTKNTYYPIRIVYQNKTDGNLTFSWSSSIQPKTTNLADNFYYINQIGWTPEVTFGTDFLENLGYANSSRPKTSYYRLNKYFLKFATLPMLADGCCFFEFFLKADKHVLDSAPQLTVRLFQTTNNTAPQLYDPSNSTLKYTKQYDIKDCLEWQPQKIDISSFVVPGSYFWVEFERRVTRSPVDGTIGIADANFIILPETPFQEIRKMTSIEADSCIGNSLDVITSNFATLSGFLNNAYCECCTTNPNPTPTPTNNPLVPTPTPTPTNNPLVPTPTPTPTNNPLVPTPTPTPQTTLGIVEIQTGIQMRNIANTQDLYPI